MSEERLRFDAENLLRGHQRVAADSAYHLGMVAVTQDQWRELARRVNDLESAKAQLQALLQRANDENAALRAIADAAREVEREWHRQEDWYRPYVEDAMAKLGCALEDFDAAQPAGDAPVVPSDAPGATKRGDTP